ncbi:hypothetical protein [Ruminococcus sp. XPD3002]|uniref:hypothetical protein n=1 Tax=Ruminococcus sp. XPD3002 TaxID=1452269 RepID=UPI000914ADF1|nr:hypothetical protein SAMN04487832_1277 [Ruminococcus flavefaciens]
MMTTKEKKRELLHRQWEEQIAECESSNMPIKEWCAVNGVNLNTSYGCSFPKWIKVRNSLISTLMSHITRILMIWLSFFKMLAFSSIMVYNVYNYSTYEVDNHDRYATQENDYT